ncbi:MAG: hypothetical protein CK425_05205 [Parachlamydia sp.]|nr:MAG: hypothetical protein CK425_05205 [Parachlamydia sp.]
MQPKPFDFSKNILEAIQNPGHLKAGSIHVMRESFLLKKFITLILNLNRLIKKANSSVLSLAFFKDLKESIKYFFNAKRGKEAKA